MPGKTPPPPVPDLAAEEPLMTPAEVAAMFRVAPKTVMRWVKEGRLTAVRTPGGHRRFREPEVRALLAGEGGDR